MGLGEKSLRMSQVAHKARGFPCFLSMRLLGVFLCATGWDVSPLQGYPQQ